MYATPEEVRERMDRILAPPRNGGNGPDSDDLDWILFRSFPEGAVDADTLAPLVPAYAAALDAFAKAQLEAPQAPEIAYDIGNTRYRSGEYEKALESYGAALTDAPPELRGRTLYNMGNAAYRLGRLEEAAKHYEAALKLDSSDEDRRLNLEFVRRQMEQQQQQQAQQQQLAQQALADPRVAIEAGRHITDSGKGLALNNETGDVSVENME